MYLSTLTLLTLFSTTVLTHPTIDERNNDLFDTDLTGRHAFPREAAFEIHPQPLIKRTTIPNLVPTTTVNLKTDSTGTAEVSPVRYGATTVSLAAGATPVTETDGATTSTAIAAGTAESTTVLTTPTSNAASTSTVVVSSAVASSGNVTGEPQRTKHRHTTAAAGSSSNAISSAPASSASGAGFEGTSSSSSGMGTRHGSVPLAVLLLLMIAGL